MLKQLILCLLLACLTLTSCQARPARPKVPAGFKVEVYAEVPGARSLTLADDGTVYVGTKGNQVFRIPDDNKDGKADGVETLISGLNFPNGVAFHQGSLYVAEIERILKFDNPRKSDRYSVFFAGLPADKHHGYRFIAFGPDNKLYVPVGAPCNVCEKPDPYAAIHRIENGKLHTVARGVRNTVGFDFHPQTKELWFTDNGRDWLGDNRPPCELNRLAQEGQHFGFPYRWGDNQPDPDLGSKAPKGLTFQKPALGFAAHVAPLGMRFYRGKMFPEKYRGQILVAQHGSWNRSSKIGYRVMLVKLQGNKVVGKEVFLGGFLNSGNVSGRPVDVQELADGSLLVSDDYTGTIYRITYGK